MLADTVADIQVMSTTMARSRSTEADMVLLMAPWERLAAWLQEPD